MDAYELFRKLSTGVKFDKKRFQTDAQRFQVFFPQHLPVFVLFIECFVYNSLLRNNLKMCLETKKKTLKYLIA